MSTIDSVAATAVAIAQARIQTEIAARLLKMSQEMGAPQQMLELVRQSVAAADQSIQASLSDGSRLVDLLA